MSTLMTPSWQERLRGLKLAAADALLGQNPGASNHEVSPLQG